MFEEIIVVPGNPDYVGACITDRNYPWHCWLRASNHIMADKEFDYFVRLDAATDCMKMAAEKTRPPQKPKWKVKWGWGKGWPGLERRW